MAVENTPLQWALLPVKRYAQFSGRSSRAEYWWFSLAFFLIGVAADSIDLMVGSEIGMLGLLVTLGLSIPLLAVTVRRLHDTDRSGWWLMVVIVPAAISGFVATTTELHSVYGPSQPATSTMTPIFAFLFACAVLTLFMVLPGNPGSNRHGPDPYNAGPEAFA